jgi:hypothetical protein
MVKIAEALTGTPPLAVPPSSCRPTTTCDEPLAFSSGVYLSVPSGLTLGELKKRVLRTTITLKVSVWPASSAGPALIAVAQPVTICAPASSATIWSGPTVKEGGSFTAATVIVTLATLESAVPSFAL